MVVLSVDDRIRELLLKKQDFGLDVSVPRSRILQSISGLF